MGYLDAYGAGDERRNRTILYLILGSLLALIILFFLWLHFRDYTEQKRVSLFLDQLRRQDFQAAYQSWGCSQTAPCRDYSFEKFMEDWGPKSPYANAANLSEGKTYSCDTGIIETLHYPGKDDVNLWVDRKTPAVAFAPWNIKSIPDDARTRFSAWIWNLRRNCKPIIAP